MLCWSVFHVIPLNKLGDWPVIAWLESRFLWLWLDSSHVEKDGDSTRLESSHVFHRMTRLESQSMTRDSSQSHFCKISEPLIDKRSLFACKEIIIFWSSNDQNWCNFLFWLSSRVILYPKGQVFITCTEVDLRFAFHWGSRRVQYRPIDTSSWSRYLHIVIMAVGHMLLLWVFSR